MLPCVRRTSLEIVDREGKATPVLRCAHPDCERFTQNVCEADCAACVMRTPTSRVVAPSIDGEKDFGEPTVNPDGSITYPKGWEPPKVPDGFQRSEHDAWTMIPLWPKCGARELHARKQSCGCVQMTAICGSTVSPKSGQLVVLADCEACPVRRA